MIWSELTLNSIEGCSTTTFDYIFKKVKKEAVIKQFLASMFFPSDFQTSNTNKPQNTRERQSFRNIDMPQCPPSLRPYSNVFLTV